MTRVAIIGAGPGGLMTAYLLERKYKNSCQTTLFEATDRVGGKILTRRFDCVPAIYEAGVAEVYDYGMIGPDPLQQLIGELGLKTTPIDGQTVVVDGKVLRNEHEIAEHCGEAALMAVEDFRRRAAAMMPIETWHEGFWQDDNEHPWARRTCEEILNEVADPAARKFLKVAVHSDLATEPHLTSGLNGLKNFVMDVPGYVRQCSIDGGMEMLPRALQENLIRTRLELNSPVVGVEKNRNEGYRISFRRNRRIEQQDFDAIFIALPHNWLNSIEWGGERLRRAMTEHIAYYDRPAHYLRITILFRKPFWQSLITDSWFMLDAFGGCCVYDESARHDVGEYGVLGWLVAGSDALTLVNLDDRTLVNRAIESLPDGLYEEAHEHFIEGKVHRWAAAVNALPGGCPVRDTRAAHLPEAKEHPGIFVVGDYLFDSTLNGVFDSANLATDLLHSMPLLVDDLPPHPSKKSATCFSPQQQ
ncbi:MAG: FAD-dependent oxidoreductase [Pyrinomonadaceae bacterium]|nr:FAD-dependent oxidoreductase [Pyrinomonadaceae bacterium]